MAKAGGRDRRLKSIFRRIQGPLRKIRGLPTLFHRRNINFKKASASDAFFVSCKPVSVKNDRRLTV